MVALFSFRAEGRIAETTDVAQYEGLHVEVLAEV